MYSFPSFELICCSISDSNCCFLTHTQVSQKTGKVVWYSHLFKNFPQFVVSHTVKGFSIANEAKVDVFLEFPCFFHDSTDAGNLISGSSAFSKSSLYIWKFLVQVLLKPSFWALPCYHVKWVQLCGSLTILWHFVLWDWNENWLFAVLWPLLSFPNLLTYRVQHFSSSIF